MSFFTDNNCQNFIATANCDDYYDKCPQFPFGQDVYSYMTTDPDYDCDNNNEAPFTAFGLFTSDCATQHSVGADCGGENGAEINVCRQTTGSAQHFDCHAVVRCIEC
jgi:hypothetical protein